MNLSKRNFALIMPLSNISPTYQHTQDWLLPNGNQSCMLFSDMLYFIVPITLDLI